MRKIGIAAAIVIAAIGIGAYLLVSNLDGLVKTAIEQIGTKVTGVTVSVSKVTISLKDGKGSIDGLTIANPKGFNTPTAISLGTIAVTIDTGSVTKNPVVIHDVTIAQPQITYELGSGGSNIDAIKKNVDSFAANAGGAGGAAKSEPAKSEPAKSNGDAKKLVIDKVSITGGKVTLASSIPGVKGTVPLPDIALKDIGKSKGGASPADVAEQVLDAITSGVAKAATSFSLSSVTDMAKGATGNIGNTVKGLLGK